MNLLQLLSDYINAQKWIGNNIVIFSAILIFIFIVLTFFVEKSQLYTSIKWSLFVISVMLIMVGYYFHDYNNIIYNNAVNLYDEDISAFVMREYERMQKIDSEYIYYHAMYVCIVAISLGTFMLLKNPTIQGVTISIALLFVVLLFIESFTRPSITAYMNALKIEIARDDNK